MLLHHVRGATSFDDLKRVTVDGVSVLCETFKEACIQRGLLQTDDEYHTALRDASRVVMPFMLREHFALLLLQVHLQDPRALWDALKAELSADFLHTRRIARNDLSLPLNEVDEQHALHRINAILVANGASLKTYDTLPQLAVLAASNAGEPYIIQAELAYDMPTLAAKVAANALRLTGEQRAIYEEIVAALDAAGADDYVPSSQVFFIHAAGGCGKTFLLELILDTVRSRGQIALATATCGVAALLLEGGCTAHHRFKLGLELNDDSRCGITPSEPEGQLMMK
jgi:hypothetical protein